MNRTTKIKITELNPHVICVLCGGYFINATTIVECLHSFCRTCITRYLETSKYCPVCDVMVHKTRPLEYIRSDKTLQDLVYKLVPGLYKNEMKRRREYYASHDPPGVQHSPSEDRGDEFYDRIIYTEDEKISLSLELCADGIPFKTPANIHGHNGPENIRIKDVRYLHCPAAFSVGNLKKFIRMKFDLKLKYEIDIFHTAEPLHDYYTLMDIAYIYTWTRRAPLRLYYTVYERKLRPRFPDPISRDQKNTVHENKALVNEKHANPSEEVVRTSEHDKAEDVPVVKKSENNAITGKRKLLEGPDDVSPDLDFEKTKTNAHEHHRKDGVVPRKRAKKLAMVDSSVMEAMSESEEQLAKLTLDCSEDAAKKKMAKNAAGERVETVDKCDTSAKVNNDMNNEGHGPTVSKCAKKLTNDNNTNEKSKDVQAESIPTSKAQVSPGSISLSLFQPLNATDINSKRNSDKVYEFTCDKPANARPKPKGKPGRKRKVISDTANNVKASDEAPVDTNLVISSKHPGLKKPGRPKKTEDNTNVEDDVNKATPSKVKRTPSKTSKKNKDNLVSKDNTEGEKVEKVKRKYVRKAVKTDETVANTPKKQQTAKTPKKNSKSDKNELKNIEAISDEKIATTSGAQKNTETDQESSDKPAPESVEKAVNNECDNFKNRGHETILPVDSTVRGNDDALSSAPVTNSVQEPVTPLYGQTPKVTELSLGLPISPNPECAENGALSGISSLNNDGNMNGANSGGYNCSVMSSNSVSEIGAFGMHSNGINAIGLLASGSNSNGLHHVGAFNPCVVSVSNNTNGFNRNNVSVGLACYSNMLPTSVSCLMGGYPRPILVPTSSIGNGYPVLDQGSDQPLDLTNNGHRDEYTKGKIFKTKMLKKSYPKTDPPQAQKDKTSVVQSPNGPNSPSWM